jgi:hypothetical protein
LRRERGNGRSGQRAAGRRQEEIGEKRGRGEEGRSGDTRNEKCKTDNREWKMRAAGRKQARKNAGALRRSGEEALREMKNVKPTTENGKRGD